LERRTARPLTIGNGFSRTYWIYLAGGALVAAGFADFSLVAFHVSKVGIVAPSTIPLLYAVAMATGAIAALVIGRSLDRCGWPVLVVGFGLSALFAPCAFGRTFTVVLAGIVLWGIGIGTQDSALKAVLSGIVPPDKRSTAFGVFDTGFGVEFLSSRRATTRRMRLEPARGVGRTRSRDVVGSWCTNEEPAVPCPAHAAGGT
jgi:MFS family permease